MGKTIRSGERNMILKVLLFFEEEKRQGAMSFPIDQAIKRTSAATGVSLRTVSNIKKEYKKLLAEQPAAPTPSLSSKPSNASSTMPRLCTPGKYRKSRCDKKVIDNNTICAIGNIVQSMYLVHKEIPTLKNILKAAKSQLNFPGESEMLRQILINKLGYKYTKCKNVREVPIEKPEVDKRTPNKEEYWKEDRLEEIQEREIRIAVRGSESKSDSHMIISAVEESTDSD